MRAKNCYSISAIKRVNKTVTIYTASVPFPFASQCFNPFDNSIPPEERAQRTLDKKHAARIRNYILNTENYYLPPLVVSVSGDVEFKPFKHDAENGILQISMTAIYTILDGQHRTQAIRDLLHNETHAPHFKDDRISVDFLLNVELSQAQTYFRLLNDTAKAVSKNLTLFYNDDPLTRQIHDILSGIALFGDPFVEKEKTNLPAKSEKLFIYKWLHTATQKMKPNLGEEFDTPYCTTFWTTLAEVIPQWKAVQSETMTAQEVRENYICSHGIFIEALGELGKHFSASCQDNPLDIKNHLASLEGVDWSKSNPDWKDQVIDARGKMLSRGGTRQFLTDYMLQMINPPTA